MEHKGCFPHNMVFVEMEVEMKVDRVGEIVNMADMVDKKTQKI